MEVSGDVLRFTSGRTLRANCGVIGLDAGRDVGSLNVSEGFDGGLWHSGMDEDDTDLTPDDLFELATHMIERWNEFRTAIILRAVAAEKAQA